MFLKRNYVMVGKKHFSGVNNMLNGRYWSEFWVGMEVDDKEREF
jgi:hypothetical protein